MSGPSEMLTKREFLEMTGVILKEILNPQMLRSALETAAVKLNIPDANALVAGMLALDNGAAFLDKSGRGKEMTDKKEKAKRNLIPYNMYVSYLSDFAAHYGRHPTIAKVKAENPTVKMGTGFCSEIYKTLSQEQKDAIMDVFKTFLTEHGAKGEAEVPGSILNAFKKYEAEHPEANIAKIIGLEARDDYKTDPAQMRLEAAEARRLADGAAGGAPTPTPFGTVAKLDFSNGHHRSEPEAGPTPGAELKSEGKERNKDKSEKKGVKRKAEQQDATAAAADGGAGAGGLQLDEATVPKKQKLDEDGMEAKPKKEKKEKDKGEKKEKEKPETAPATGGKESTVKSEKKKDKGDKSEQKHKDKSKEEKKSEKKHKDKSEKHVQHLLLL